MNIFKKILKYIFYNPYKTAQKHSNISLEESTVLLKSCTFRFENKSNNCLIKIGKDTMLGCNFIFESDEGTIKIGNNTFINEGTNLISRSGIEIGNFVTISWGCTIYNHNSHSLDYIERQNDLKRQLRDYHLGMSFIHSKNWNVVKSSPIVIEDNVWIGFESVILNGVTIGEGAIVGARSVVRENVPPWTVVAGNPAVIVKKLRQQ